MARGLKFGNPGDVNRARAIGVAVVATALVAIGIVATSASARSSATVKSLPTLNQQVFAAINTFRTLHGLVALKDSKSLDRAALVHSIQMGRRGYFSHNSANGEQFYTRVERYYGTKGYRAWTVGENLVWDATPLTAATALAQWIKSPPHLKNLKTAKWRDLGVSAVGVTGSGGVYGRKPVTIVTTDFGVRTR
jgi:uncharacterized protein YkwD